MTERDTRDTNEKNIEKPSPWLSQMSSEMRGFTADAPELDFDRIEKALLARTQAETQRRRFRSRATWGIGALAVAATVALFASRAPHLDREGVARDDGANPSTVASGAGELQSGTVTVAGHALAQGQSIQRGDEIETAHALFRSPGRVVYSVTSGNAEPTAQLPAHVLPAHLLPAQLTVTETDRPIVLALSRGVVEAQVDKVPSGEAFAVDVIGDPSSNAPGSSGSVSDHVRIAVHGTHLRVARDGRHVVLDLTEGIVNVGHPPKTGSTYGKLVTAPAHVEFDVDALETTFTMTKDAAQVRTAEDLSPAPVTPTLVVATGNDPPAADVKDPDNRGAVVAPARLVRPGNKTDRNEKSVSDITPPSNAKDPLNTTAVAPAPEPQPDPRLDPGTAITNAIATCTNLQPPSLTKVSVASTLSLRVGDDGYVQAARFWPPLEPALQTCAATTIYKVRFDKPGTVTLPVSIER